MDIDEYLEDVNSHIKVCNDRLNAHIKADVEKAKTATEVGDLMDNPKEYSKHYLTIAMLDAVRHVFAAVPLELTPLYVENVMGCPVIKKHEVNNEQ